MIDDSNKRPRSPIHHNSDAAAANSHDSASMPPTKKYKLSTAVKGPVKGSGEDEFFDTNETSSDEEAAGDGI